MDKDKSKQQNNMKNAAGLVSIIKEVVNNEVDKTDSTEICLIESINEDGSLNVYIIPDKETIIRNISNESKYVFNSGDYAILYKIRNRLSNSFVIAKINPQQEDNEFFTLIKDNIFTGEQINEQFYVGGRGSVGPTGPQGSAGPTGPTGPKGGADCTSSVDSGIVSYTLKNDEDKTFTSVEITELNLIIPNTVFHGFFCGVNFTSGENSTILRFTNESRMPLLLMKKGMKVDSYSLSPMKSILLVVICDGINVYSNLIEV